MSDSLLTLKPPLAEEFELGEWIVCPELNRYWHRLDSGSRQTLEPRLMHLLCFLAANKGRVVSREQLFGELWPRVVVNENSLTRAVSALRKKLSPGGNSDRGWLETVPKKGYRLVCPVTPRRASLCSSFGAGTPPGAAAPGRSRAPWTWPALAACILVVLMFEAAGFRLPLAETAWSPVALVSDQVVDLPAVPGGADLALTASHADGTGKSGLSVGEQYGTPVVSVDGKMVAFIRYEGGTSGIYLASIQPGSEPARVYSSTDHLYNLAWSPLGNALLFAADRARVQRALLGDHGQAADLLMLDLESRSVRVLIDNSPGVGTTTGGHTV